MLDMRNLLVGIIIPVSQPEHTLCKVYLYRIYNDADNSANPPTSHNTPLAVLLISLYLQRH
jgi:hypothetical protein